MKQTCPTHDTSSPCTPRAIRTRPHIRPHAQRTETVSKSIMSPKRVDRNEDRRPRGPAGRGRMRGVGGQVGDLYKILFFPLLSFTFSRLRRIAAPFSPFI